MRTPILAGWAIFVFSSLAYAQQSAWADKLFGGETGHDFSSVQRGTQLRHTFKMTNIYKVPLEITDIKIQCGCVKAEPTTKILQPNETAMLHVSMDTRAFVGPKTVKVYVSVGPKFVSTATLTVSANARGDVVFAPSEIDFGVVQRGQTPTKSIDVEYVGTTANWRVVEILKHGTAPFELKVEDLPRSLNGPAKKGYRILATLKADAAGGAFKQEVTLKTNDSATPTHIFHIVGTIQAGLAVSPNPIVVKDLKVGETQTKKVFLGASRPFRIVGIDGQGEGISAEYPNREETTQIITVSFAPGKAGDIRRQLLIRTDLDKESTPLVVQMTVTP